MAEAIHIPESSAPTSEFSTLYDNGVDAYSRGQYQQALDYYRQALAIARETECRACEGATLHDIGMVYQAQELYDQALEYHQQALVIAREVGLRVLEEDIQSY
jgi:tetratricopeptide (TPR) repeat protein